MWVTHSLGHIRVKPIRSPQKRAFFNKKHARCAPSRPPENPFTLPQTGSSVSANFLQHGKVMRLLPNAFRNGLRKVLAIAMYIPPWYDAAKNAGCLEHAN